MAPILWAVLRLPSGRAIIMPNLVPPVVTGAEAAAYRDLIRRENAPPDKDTIAGHFFNNLATVRLKTELTLEHGYGGVMVWELSQDAAGEQSLLRAIHGTALREAKAPAATDRAR